ncbi:activating transcription factor 4b isoform X2 [Sander vitreus]
MTMMMTNSQFGLEDMEALLWGPSSPMADAASFLSSGLEQENQEGEGTSLEGDTSPVSPLNSSSLSSSSSPPPFYSPPPSPPAVLLQGDKAGTESDLLSLHWLGHPGQLRQAVSDDSKDMFGDLDWMAERVDLSEFDLDSLIGSCGPTEESPSCPEDLLASLDCPMELDSLPLPTLSTPALSSLPSDSLPSIPTPPAVCSDPCVITVDEPESYIGAQDVPYLPPCVPEPQQELEIKSEPTSPEPLSPLVDSPSSPAYTLDLGSEVDVSESELKPVVATVVSQVPRLVLSLSPTRIVLVLAPKNEIGITTTTTTVTTTSQIVHHSSPPASPPPKSSKSRPYPEPTYKASPPSPSPTGVKVKSLQVADGDVKATLKAPKAKKLKKMEQNKTAATRYRQKKRAEQDSLLAEHTLLERKNMELNEKAESMAREIEYLKELMEEVRQAKTKKCLGADH